nr:hypothetical protein [Solirubrobacterales bacterium]
MTARIPKQDNETDPAPGGVPVPVPRARLASPPPERIAVGAGTALVLEGTLESNGFGLEGVRIRLGEIEREVDAFGVDSGRTDAGLWWTVLPIPAGTAGSRLLELIARGGGEEVIMPLGEIELLPEAPVETSEPRKSAANEPLIAICMATHEPAEDRLRRQLDSIRAQGRRRWICLISDD